MMTAKFVKRAFAWLAACILSAACAPRTELPLPTLPLTRTPDAPFRSRHVPIASPSILEPDVHRQTLENGLTLIHLERPQVPDVVVTYVNRQAGTLTSEYPGVLLRLTAAALLRGGTRWRDQGILADLNVNREFVSGGATPEATIFELRGLDVAFEQITEVMAQTVREPAFTPGGVEAARTSVRADLGKVGSWGRVMSIVVGDSDASQFVGTGDVTSLTLDQLKSCYADLYRPESSAVIVAGAVSFERAL